MTTVISELEYSFNKVQAEKLEELKEQQRLQAKLKQAEKNDQDQYSEVRKSTKRMTFKLLPIRKY